MKLKLFSHIYSSIARTVSKMEDETFFDAPEAVSPGFAIALVTAVFLVTLLFSVTLPFRRFFKS